LKAVFIAGYQAPTAIRTTMIPPKTQRIVAGTVSQLGVIVAPESEAIPTVLSLLRRGEARRFGCRFNSERRNRSLAACPSYHPYSDQQDRNPLARDQDACPSAVAASAFQRGGRGNIRGRAGRIWRAWIPPSCEYRYRDISLRIFGYLSPGDGCPM